MLTTMEDTNQLDKKLKNVQELFMVPTVKGVTRADLIDYEVGIVFLEGMVKALEGFIELRQTASKSHLVDVEKRIDELSVSYLESYKKRLQARVNAWGRRPFEDYVHEKGIYK